MICTINNPEEGSVTELKVDIVNDLVLIFSGLTPEAPTDNQQ